MSKLLIKNLKNLLEDALNTTPSLRTARVIIYYDSQERDHLARGARIITNRSEIAYDGTSTTEDSIEKNGSALAIVDLEFSDGEELQELITIGDLIEILNQKDVNLDADVLCHFAVKDFVVYACEARIFTAPDDHYICDRATIASAIAECGAALVISDYKLN